MNMIEKVARAIAGSAASAFGDRAIHYVENNWGAYTNQARAAIAALREPTEWMTEIGYRSTEHIDFPKDATLVWQAMIDQALKEDS